MATNGQTEEVQKARRDDDADVKQFREAIEDEVAAQVEDEAASYAQPDAVGFRERLGRLAGRAGLKEARAMIDDAAGLGRSAFARGPFQCRAIAAAADRALTTLDQFDDWCNLVAIGPEPAVSDWLVKAMRRLIGLARMLHDAVELCPSVAYLAPKLLSRQLLRLADDRLDECPTFGLPENFREWLTELHATAVRASLVPTPAERGGVAHGRDSEEWVRADEASKASGLNADTIRKASSLTRGNWPTRKVGRMHCYRLTDLEAQWPGKQFRSSEI